MKDCHANLFLGLTAPNRFSGVRLTRGDPSIPSLFSCRVEPRFTGHGNLFGNDLREMLAVLMLSLRVDDTSGFPFWPKVVKSAGPL